MKKQLYILGLMSLLVSVGNVHGDIFHKSSGDPVYHVSGSPAEWYRPKASGHQDEAQALEYCFKKCSQHKLIWSGEWKIEGDHSVICGCLPQLEEPFKIRKVN